MESLIDNKLNMRLTYGLEIVHFALSHIIQNVEDKSYFRLKMKTNYINNVFLLYALNMVDERKKERENEKEREKGIILNVLCMCVAIFQEKYIFFFVLPCYR